MAKSLSDLSEAGKEELALALILWRAFKKSGAADIKIFQQAYELAEMLGVKKQFEELDRKIITPVRIILEA